VNPGNFATTHMKYFQQNKRDKRLAPEDADRQAKQNRRRLPKNTPPAVS